MKLILFAFAAIAFSGSSKAKTRDEATPSEPEKPVPQTKPQPVPQPVVPIPEPAVELSAEEEAAPVTTFDAMKTKVYEHHGNLIRAEEKVKVEENALAKAKSAAEKAGKAKDDALELFMNLRDLSEKKSHSEAEKQTRKAELQSLRTIWKNKEKAEEKATQTVKDTNTRIIEAQKAFNEALDKMVAAEHDVRSKGPLLVQRANEITESEKQKVKEAGEAFEESKQALEKQEKIKAYLEKEKFGVKFPKEAMDDAKRFIVENTLKVSEDEKALEVAQANAENASKGAENLEKERSVLAAFCDKFFSSNQNKKY